MANVHALVVYDFGTALGPIQKTLEERGLSIHISASWEEADRAYSVLLDRIKYTFVDISMCHGGGWEKFIHRTRIGGSNSSLIVFNPRFPQNFNHLLGCETRAHALP